MLDIFGQSLLIFHSLQHFRQAYHLSAMTAVGDLLDLLIPVLKA
jgi:hypothetical protein